MTPDRFRTLRSLADGIVFRGMGPTLTMKELANTLTETLDEISGLNTEMRDAIGERDEREGKLLGENEKLRAALRAIRALDLSSNQPGKLAAARREIERLTRDVVEGE